MEYILINLCNNKPCSNLSACLQVLNISFQIPKLISLPEQYAKVCYIQWQASYIATKEAITKLLLHLRESLPANISKKLLWKGLAYIGMTIKSP